MAFLQAVLGVSNELRSVAVAGSALPALCMMMMTQDLCRLELKLSGGGGGGVGGWGVFWFYDFILKRKLPREDFHDDKCDHSGRGAICQAAARLQQLRPEMMQQARAMEQT